MSRVLVVIWMNIPSHHQTAFFKALGEKKRFELQIRYYDKISEDRKKLGWSPALDLPENQCFVNNDNVIEALESVNNWEKGIHIIPGFSNPFLKTLLEIFIQKNIQWIHWSERSGKQFNKLLNYNDPLIKLLYPLFLWYKGYYSYAKKINKHALGAFAISSLAYKDFRLWGVNNELIKRLNYSLEPLTKPVEEEVGIFNGDKKERYFIYAGVLTKHKGIEILLKAFANLENAQKWKLVLIGNDNSNGAYLELSKSLKIFSRVWFVGAVSHSEVNKYLTKAHVLILPTFFDGWGAVLNEGASLSKPLISTDQCGAAYQLIEDGKNGFIVKAKSISRLKRAMQYYVDNPECITIHGDKSLDLFKKISPKPTADLFEKNVFELLGIEI